MAEIHQILFNMHILYSLALGIWACVTAARNEPISGHYWGAILTYALLAGADAAYRHRPAADRLSARLRTGGCIRALYAVAGDYHARTVQPDERPR